MFHRIAFGFGGSSVGLGFSVESIVLERASPVSDFLDVC